MIEFIHFCVLHISPASSEPEVELLTLVTPMVTSAKAMEMIASTKPTTNKAIECLAQVGILEEITGKQRDRIYAYRRYLDVLAENTDTRPE